MADENKPAFYPRVGNIKAKNFKPAKPMPFIDDPRAMELPQFGEVDVGVASQQNLELGRRMVERENQLRRQREADRSPLEKAAGALEAVRFMGSALTQAINSLPTRMVHGDKAAEKFMEERMFKPEQPLAYEYVQDVGNFLDRLETEYKIPPILPEAVALQYLTGPATAQAARAAGKGAVKAGMALERRMEPVVKGALEQGGLPREMVMAMGQGTQSNVIKSERGNWVVDPKMGDLYSRAGYKPDLEQTFAELQQRYTPESMANFDPNVRANVERSISETGNAIALDKWIDSNVKNYVKNEMGTPSDPIRLFIEKREAEINAKFELDQQRAQRIADRAEAEPDPRRKANLTRQSAQMMEEAEINRDMAMKHKSHLPPDLQNPETMWTPEELARTRKLEGFPEEEIGKTKSSQMWEQMADESIYPSKARDIQQYPAQIAKRNEAYLKLADFEAKVDQKLRDKFLKAGVDEDVLNRYLQNTLITEKAEVVGEAKLGRKLYENVGPLPSNQHFLEYASQSNPWVSKLDPNTSVYSGDISGLNFGHIIDVLKQDLAEKRIRPEQLNKMSMEQAVRRTAEYDLERAQAMREAQIKNMSGFPTYKEYPEGYRWVELTNPNAVPEGYVLPEGMKLDTIDHPRYGLLHTVSDPKGITQIEATDSPESALLRFYNRRGGEGYKSLEDALKYEGDTMGHCVGGYCPDVASGNTKIYSLRDSRGEPHVTVEVEGKPSWFTKAENIPDPSGKYKNFYELIDNERNELAKQKGGFGNTGESFEDTANRLAQQYSLENVPSIIQIKGKQNLRPIEKYDPYTQDFVQSGNWDRVFDLQNTGLIDVKKSMIPWPSGTQAEQIDNLVGGLEGGTKTPKYKSGEEFLNKAQQELNKRYITQKEYDDWLLKQLTPDAPPAPEMKRGGKVSISNNPDTMMLELGNKRMKEGGSENDTKPFFGGAGTKKYAAAKKRAEQGDVNTLQDPRTYATVAGFFGERPDEMGFSVMHPDYQGVREAADPAFYAGTALGVAPLMKVFKAPAMALGRAGERYAEKVVPQIMERGGVGADMLGGLAQGTRSYAYLPHTEKSPNPLVGTRYKTQYVGNLAPKFDFDVQAEQGSSVMSNPWDLTSRGEKVLEVSDIPMSNQMITEGGHDFARDLANIQANIGGASGRQIAERMQDRVNDATFANLFDKGTGRVFTMPSTMDVKGSHFSTMPTDLVMDIFQQAGLKPKDVERITDDLRSFVFETEKGKFKNAAPVGSPEFMLQLRQGGKGFSAGDLRKGLMDRMSQKEYQKMLGFNIEDVYGAIGDQSLKGLPKGFVGNTMIETSPFAGLKPATHQSYDTANMGKYAGSMPSMPLELMMPDLFRAIEINYLKDPRYRKLTPLQLRTMIVNTIEKRGNVISQPINQRVVDNVMRYKQGLAQGHFKPNDYDSIMEFMRRTGGYKDGGAVHKAEGGEITGDDLIIEERPL